MVEMTRREYRTFNYHRALRRVFTEEYLQPLAAYVRSALGVTKRDLNSFRRRSRNRIRGEDFVLLPDYPLPVAMVVSVEEQYKKLFPGYWRWRKPPEQVFREQGKEPPRVPFASYNRYSKMIIVRPDIFEDHPIDRNSILIHELVHFYQDRIEHRHRLFHKEREEEARKIEACYLIANGIKPKKAFEDTCRSPSK